MTPRRLSGTLRPHGRPPKLVEHVHAVTRPEIESPLAFIDSLPPPTVGSSRVPSSGTPLHFLQLILCLLGQAGYDTKTSLITRFYTFAPETLAELLGQRRRWQVSMKSVEIGLPRCPPTTDSTAGLGSVGA